MMRCAALPLVRHPYPQWTTLFGSCAVLGAAAQLTRLYVAGCHSLEAEEGEEGGEPEEGGQGAGGGVAGGGGDGEGGPAVAAGAAQHGEQEEDGDLGDLEDAQEGAGGGPAAPHHPQGAAAGAGGGGGGAGAGPPAPAPAAAAAIGAEAALAAAADATASTQHPMASSEEVAAMLAALPALREFVDVILPDAAQRGGLDAAVAALMYALPRRCPRLELSIREDDGFGWALPDLLQRTGEVG